MKIPRRTPGDAALVYEAQEVDGHSILARDAAGGVRIVEALGDVAMADHIAVVVPGNGHYLSNYFSQPASVGPRAHGQLVLRAMQTMAPESRVAVVVWVGYNTPPGLVAAALNTPARNGAEDLARLTHYLPSSAHLTLVGHSYGTVVSGLALASARVDDCVALGSPGMGVGTREELGTGTRLWAAQAETDWIRFFPRARIGALGLGRPALHPSLLATRFATGDIVGHCAYYEDRSESLRNIARIALGRYDEVTRPGDALAPFVPASRSTRRPELV